ncbi:MAG: hypothetical protein WC693_06130, partial [Patescibacteria group bacterium]
MFDDDFCDFAMRFVSFTEYEELIRDCNLSGGNAYSPKARKGSQPEQAPAFKEYLEEVKQKTWQEVIADETDWPQGSMSVNMYNHLLDTLKQAKESTETEDQSKENYRARIINEMRRILETEIQKEVQVRQDVSSNTSIEGQDYLDYIDERYDIFLMAMYLPQ